MINSLLKTIHDKSRKDYVMNYEISFDDKKLPVEIRYFEEEYSENAFVFEISTGGTVLFEYGKIRNDRKPIYGVLVSPYNQRLVDHILLYLLREIDPYDVHLLHGVNNPVSISNPAMEVDFSSKNYKSESYSSRNDGDIDLIDAALLAAHLTSSDD